MKELIEILLKWPKNFITGTDLKFVLDKSYDSRHGIIKRACDEEILIRLRNDLYLIKQLLRRDLHSEFELAQMIWGPSYISLESALSHYGWIPEAVYTTTSACSKKTKTVTTSIGVFSYKNIPLDAFSMGLHSHHGKIETYLIAEPWKAVADLIYTKRKTWKNLKGFSEDLRVEEETIHSSDTDLLGYLSESYPSPRTQKILNQFYQELKNDKGNHSRKA